MHYAIVIATRNRIGALRASLPHMLSQQPRASQLIVVDSSDDHDPVRRLVQEVATENNVPHSVLHTSRGASLQRNIGLALVKHPIVFFPDDDSIFFPNTSKSILDVYIRDQGRQVAAVCAFEALSAPANLETDQLAYPTERRKATRQGALRLRSKVERIFFPDPIRTYAKHLIAKAQIPNWTHELGLVPVEWMTGFRMTFRTELAFKYKFDENLTRYSLFEDRDISLKMWIEGSVLATPSAKIYHHKSPEKRDDGYRMGVIQILNLAYLTAKHTPLSHSSRSYLRRFCLYKATLYRLSSKDKFTQSRFEGAKAALQQLSSFISSHPNEAASTYHRALTVCLDSRQNPQS